MLNVWCDVAPMKISCIERGKKNFLQKLLPHVGCGKHNKHKQTTDSFSSDLQNERQISQILFSSSSSLFLIHFVQRETEGKLKKQNEKKSIDCVRLSRLL